MIAIGAVIDGDRHPMPQNTILRTRNRTYIYSWTTGVTEAPLPQPKTERDVLSYALWLAQHGREEEADMVVERFCATRIQR